MAAIGVVGKRKTDSASRQTKHEEPTPADDGQSRNFIIYMQVYQTRTVVENKSGRDGKASTTTSRI